MRKLSIYSISILFSAINLYPAVLNEKAPPFVVQHARGKIVKFERVPVIVNAVKAENNIGKHMRDILNLNEQWRLTRGLADWMKSYMVSKCGQYLRKIQQLTPYYAVIFVMSSQGACVAMTDRIENYWYGNDEIFLKSFNEGKGDIYISDVIFDEASQAYLVYISVPVMDGDKAIGVISFGIDVDRMQDSYTNIE